MTTAARRTAPMGGNAPQTNQNGPGNAPQGAGGATLPATVGGASTAIALPADLQAKLAAAAKDIAAKERPSVSRIGLRAGVITYGGNPVKGNALSVIVLAAGHKNAYYDKPFDPNNLQNPACFALSITGEDMQAHENVPEDNVPGESRSCKDCPLHQWGSDPRGGRGKACKETRRVVLMPADAAESAEAAAKAELALVDIPVTSGKNYSNFVNALAASASVPPWAAITTLSTQPDAKTQFKVVFTPTSTIADPLVLEAVYNRMEEAERLLLLPYDEVSSTETGKMQPAPQKAKY